MHPHVGDVVEPLPSLLIEIGVVDERPSVDEIVPQIADRTLDFALGLRAVGATRARREAPVMRKAEKLEIAHERAALQPQVARDHRLHLIEEQLLRDPAEVAKRLLECRRSASACPGADKTGTTARASSRARRATRTARPTRN